MKVLITGALGHIGSLLIRELPRAYPDSEIIMLDNLRSQRYCSLFHLPDGATYRFIEADVLTIDLDKVLCGTDVVVHLAAITDAARSFQNREEVEYVNYTATARVAEACSKAHCPMIHLSSTSIYGTQHKIIDENCSEEELQPQSPYAETKLREERLLQDLGRSKNLHFVTCRFGTICGVAPGMRFHTAVNKFCWQAVTGLPLTVWRTALHQKRPYLTLSDAIEAIKFIMRHELFDLEIYNVLTENLTVNSLIQFIKQYIQGLEIQYVDSEIMNQLSYEVSNERFKQQGFEFKGSVEQSITETIKLLENIGRKYVT
ncbi:MAG: SDR family oxidoreductase [bacterium]|nr:SDR family oxidoreductase [bacterium]